MDLTGAAVQLADLVALDQDGLRCPAEAYERMRERGVHYAPEVDAYVVSRHADVVAVLRDGERFSSANTVGNPPVRPQDDDTGLRPLLLLSDDPLHARRRSIVNRVFTPARVAAWEPQISEVCARLVDGLRGRTDIDLVRDLAALLPIRVISLVLGVPQRDVDRFRAWSEEITSSLGGHSGDAARRERVQNEFTGYIGTLLDERDGMPGEDVLSLIGEAERQGELSRRECVRFVIELLIAGNITTTHHLASSMALLGRVPGLFERLRREPDLIGRFIEESLRLEAPIQCFYRLVTVDGLVGGVEVPAGSRLLVFYGSANRDPQVWEQCPHLVLDRRNGSAHLAFGKGAHACIGASLARLESRVVLQALLERIESVELLLSHEQQPYLPSFVNHGPISLPARLVFLDMTVGSPRVP
ncbi:cytochrome P450 [Pseudonocardia yunnanensis]|uniref:Cytochrome P450 n=1 Tax=Pseudonocardia yunnanensis TaxID=58107 RepID=A0ABW4EUF5_9PSEU